MKKLYTFYWDDGTEETTELHPNGTTVTIKHMWNKVGDYTIRVKAIDEHKAESNWSEFTITIPRNKIFNLKLLDMLFSRFPNAFPILQKLIQKSIFGQ